MLRLRPAAPVGFTLGLTLAGCASDRRATTAGVRDSAGIVVVDNPQPAQGESYYQIDSLPIATFGEGDDSAQVGNPRRLRDGRVLVLEYNAKNYRLYDSTGKFLATVGRQGQGPGEFQYPQFLGQGDADTLIVYDWSAARLSFFTPGGQFARSLSWGDVEGSSRVVPSVAMAGRRLLATTRAGNRGEPVAGLRLDTTQLVTVDWNGATASTVGTFQSGEEFLVIKPNMMIGSMIHFARRTLTGVLDTLVVVADSRQYALDLYTPGGKLVRRIRRAYQLRPTTDEDVSMELNMYLDRSPPTRHAELRERSAAVPRAPFHPAFDWLLVSEAGDLWLRDYRRPQDRDLPQQFTIFDRNGTWLSTLTVSNQLHLDWIGTNSLLGTWTDEDDVTHVRLYRLRRSSPQ